MKILFYADTVFGFGGVQRVLAVIAKALAKDNDVTILSTDTDENLSMCRKMSLRGSSMSESSVLSSSHSLCAIIRYACLLFAIKLLH